MPDIYPSSGFDLAAIPQYNPVSAQDFVRNPVAALPAIQQGTNLAGNLVSFLPELHARIGAAKLQNAQQSAQLDNVHAIADAQLAKAKLDKSLANLGTQKNESEAQQLDYLSNTSLQQILGGSQQPSAMPSQSTTTPSTIPAQPAFQLGGAMGAAIGLPVVPQSTPTPPSPAIIASPQGQQSTQIPISGVQVSPYLNQLWKASNVSQRQDIVQNLIAAQSPQAQAQVAKIYSDLQESVNHGEYFKALADWRKAEADNLVKTGGKYGAQNQIIQAFTKNGGVLGNVIDSDAYHEAQQEAINDGGTAEDVRLTDFINPDKLKAESDRINKLQDKKATKAGGTLQYNGNGDLNSSSQSTSSTKNTVAPPAQTGQDFYNTYNK